MTARAEADKATRIVNEVTLSSAKSFGATAIEFFFEVFYLFEV